METISHLVRTLRMMIAALAIFGFIVVESAAEDLNNFGSWERTYEPSWNPRECIHCIFHDQEDLVWFGCNNGLRLMTGTEAIPVEIPGVTGPALAVTSISEVSGQSGVWFMTKKGIGHVSAKHPTNLNPPTKAKAKPQARPGSGHHLKQRIGEGRITCEDNQLQLTFGLPKSKVKIPDISVWKNADSLPILSDDDRRVN